MFTQVPVAVCSFLQEVARSSKIEEGCEGNRKDFIVIGLCHTYFFFTRRLTGDRKVENFPLDLLTVEFSHHHEERKEKGKVNKQYQISRQKGPGKRRKGEGKGVRKAFYWRG